MSATAAPAATDRSDFRTVTVGGALVGLVTGVAVVLVVAASRTLPPVGGGLVVGALDRIAHLAAATTAAAAGACTIVLAALPLVALTRRGYRGGRGTCLAGSPFSWLPWGGRSRRCWHGPRPTS